jgi:hypothetical protein
MAEETPTRWPSNAELDLEARRKAADESQGEAGDVYAPFAVEGNDTSAYVGVSPEYMTYSNETEKPLRAEEGVEADLEAEALDSPSPVLQPAQQVGDAEVNPASPAGVTAQTTVDTSEDSGNTPPVPPAPPEEPVASSRRASTPRSSD